MLQENYKLAAEMDEKINEFSTIYVYADDMKNVTAILDKIRKFGFEAYSDTQWIEQMQNEQKAQQGQLAAIGLISLVVSAIGIANTMMPGILERRGEIGVMKVVGVAIRKIRRLFLIESAMIGIVGGVAGVVLSHILAYLLSTGSNATVFLGMNLGSGTKFVMPFWLDATAVGVAVVVGIIAGIIPARKATKMSPLEAIRTA
jgi:ABC-type antimicrobial peptide transport system permease subunit